MVYMSEIKNKSVLSAVADYNTVPRLPISVNGCRMKEYMQSVCSSLFYGVGLNVAMIIRKNVHSCADFCYPYRTVCDIAEVVGYS